MLCGSAKTSLHNTVFLSGLLRTLEAAPEYQGNRQFSSEPQAALRAFAHIYAGWGLSQDFSCEELFRTELGSPDLDTFLRTEWEDGFAAYRAANLYAQARTWQESDISADPRYGGDLVAALGAIRARVLPGETDLYFRVAANAAELEHLTRVELPSRASGGIAPAAPRGSSTTPTSSEGQSLDGFRPHPPTRRPRPEIHPIPPGMDTTDVGAPQIRPP